MVIMYSRFHNYAARTLAAINEDGRFTVPDANDTEAVKKRDNDLFQVARLFVPLVCYLHQIALTSVLG